MHTCLSNYINKLSMRSTMDNRIFHSINNKKLENKRIQVIYFHLKYTQYNVNVCSAIMLTCVVLKLVFFV